MSDHTENNKHLCDDCEDESSSESKSIFSSEGALKIFMPISGMFLLLGFVVGFSFDGGWVALFYVLSILAGSIFVVQRAFRGSRKTKIESACIGNIGHKEPNDLTLLNSNLVFFRVIYKDGGRIRA